MTIFKATWSKNILVPCDDLIENWIKDKIKEFNKYKKDKEEYYGCSIGSIVQINALRLAVKNKQLKSEEIEFHYKHYVLYADKEGNLDSYPLGFGDLLDFQCSSLLGWDK